MKRSIDIVLSPHAGYCFGVKRALRIVEEGLSSFGPPIYTLGDLIHNPPEVERLRARGVVAVASLDEVPSGATLVLRAHGVDPVLARAAAARGVRVLDATCPFVQRSQSLARRMAEEGRRVIIVGDREHPEVRAVAAHAGGAAIVASREDAAALPPIERAGVVVQTTFPRPEAEAIIDALRDRIPDLRVNDTICGATEARRDAALELARRVDLMIVIGGRNSSNTKRLFRACGETGVAARLVESPADLDPAWFSGVSRVGVTTGTSTPDWLIEAVLGRLEEIAGGAR